jgi:hypothetical protein
MFERYIQKVNPEEGRFQSFISNYLVDRGVKDIHTLPYSELYKFIKEGIREYLRKHTEATVGK